MSALDYGDVIYMHAPSHSLHALDTVFYGALRFIANLKLFTHYYLLYTRVGWSALSAHRLKHLHVIIYKSILGLLPQYLQTYIRRKDSGSYSLRSQDLFLLTLSNIQAEMGKRTFKYAAPIA